MVGAPPRDHVRLLRPPHRRLRELRHAIPAVDRGRPARGELHAGDPRRRKFGKLRCQHRSRIVRHVDERVGKGEPFGLFGDGLRHLAPAKPDIGAPEPAHSVEIAPSCGVPEIAAFSAADHKGTVALEAFEMSPGMQGMRAVHLGQRFR